MKYEAKNVGGVATSTPAGTPWVSISQTSAITTSQAACSGCHLITEAEWLTIVQNVLSVSSNWSGGAVGSGYIYSGHNDNAPAIALAADTNDANGYFGETNTGGTQRRTLTLTNGQVIWDLAGNVNGWTNGTVVAGQPGIASGGYYGWRDWNAITTPGNLSPSPFPSYGTPAANAWTLVQGIGEVTYADESAARGFFRGGNWNGGGSAGVSALNSGGAPSNTYTTLGFRVSR